MLNATLKGWFAVSAIVVASAVPIVAGIAVAFDPLVERNAPEWVAVTMFESLPADGMPRRFPVILPQSDAWAKLPGEVVDFVFLRRLQESGELIALRATYGRVHWLVEFDAEAGTFDVPCLIDFRFDINGRKVSPIPEEAGLERVQFHVASGMVYIKLSDASALGG